jgi:nucleotide-binding universal stress UspA family protein
MTATSALNEHVVRDTGAQSIVVGVDWSSGAQLAIDHAARRLAAGGRLIVAHVMTPLPMVATNVLAEFTPQRHASALELVDRLTGRLDVDTDTVVLDGLPAERLASLARHHDADEIVVGSRRLSRIGAALGSVSHALLERADRPVVIVPPPGPTRRTLRSGSDEKTIIVGYDGSEAARAAVAYATRRVSNPGRVVAVHAFQGVPDRLGFPSYQRVLDASQAEGRRHLEALEAEWSAKAHLETSLLEGPAARAVLSAADAREADEIVVGSRGFGPFRGALGSVSHALLRDADRVVVVIPDAAVRAAGIKPSAPQRYATTRDFSGLRDPIPTNPAAAGRSLALQRGLGVPSLPLCGP